MDRDRLQKVLHFFLFYTLKVLVNPFSTGRGGGGGTLYKVYGGFRISYGTG